MGSFWGLTGAGRASYRTTLHARDKIEDEEQRHQLLTDCHKRCAQRALQVLEQNGGIFIKLGQHLVSIYLSSPLPGSL